MVDVIADVFLDDVSDGLLDFGCCPEESASWYVDGGTGFFKCEELPELCLVGELDGTLVVTPAPVFLSSECSRCLVVFVPEEAFHFLCDNDFPSVVVYFGVWEVGVEDDRVFRCAAFDTTSQLTRIDEDMPSRTCR